MIIATTSDQRWMAPEVIITSRTKNVDKAVYVILEEPKSGTLKPGIRRLDLKASGVGLAPLEHKSECEMRNNIS